MKGHPSYPVPIYFCLVTFHLLPAYIQVGRNTHLFCEGLVHCQGPESTNNPYWPCPASPGASPTPAHGLWSLISGQSRAINPHPGDTIRVFVSSSATALPCLVMCPAEPGPTFRLTSWPDLSLSPSTWPCPAILGLYLILVTLTGPDPDPHSWADSPILATAEPHSPQKCLMPWAGGCPHSLPCSLIGGSGRGHGWQDPCPASWKIPLAPGPHKATGTAVP